MAKDVDLSSKEWTDIVFQGKNKEFGAYTLRADSILLTAACTLIELCTVEQSLGRDTSFIEADASEFALFK